MPGGFRTPTHGVRTPSSDADDVAAQIADRLAEHQMGAERPDSGLTLVFHALQDLKGDVKEHGKQLGKVAVEMATMNGETQLINQRIGAIEGNVGTLSRQVERGGYSTGERPAIRPRVEVPRSDNADRVTISGAVKLIGAIFSGLALIAGAYFTGRGHGASTEKDNAAVHASPTAGHTPP